MFENENKEAINLENEDNTEIEQLAEQEIIDSELDDSNITKVEDVMEGKINYFDLPKQERDRLLSEYQNSLPEDSIARKEGYAPPQMFGGKDRFGNPIKAKTIEEFEADFHNRKKGNSRDELGKTKEELAEIKKQMSEMRDMLKMQTNNSLANEEEKINYKINELKSNGIYTDEDFDLYNKLNKRKSQIELEKNQFNKPVEQPKQLIHQFNDDELNEINNFRESNLEFSNKLGLSPLARAKFDQVAAATYAADPSLNSQDILFIAKNAVEKSFPNIFQLPKKNNTFMNTQYQTPNNANTVQKKVESPKINYDSLSPSDKHFINGELRNNPGMTSQQVAEKLFARLVKK
jgi:hypothetical protein